MGVQKLIKENFRSSYKALLSNLVSPSGHTDVVMGAAVTNDDKLAERLRFLQNGKPPLADSRKGSTVSSVGIVPDS